MPVYAHSPSTTSESDSKTSLLKLYTLATLIHSFLIILGLINNMPLYYHAKFYNVIFCSFVYYPPPLLSFQLIREQPSLVNFKHSFPFLHQVFKGWNFFSLDCTKQCKFLIHFLVCGILPILSFYLSVLFVETSVYDTIMLPSGPNTD